jgi:hypothetical protein
MKGLKIRIDGNIEFTPENVALLNKIEASMISKEEVDYTFSQTKSDTTQFWYKDEMRQNYVNYRVIDLESIVPKGETLYESYQDAIKARDEYDAKMAS